MTAPIRGRSIAAMLVPVCLLGDVAASPGGETCGSVQAAAPAAVVKSSRKPKKAKATRIARPTACLQSPDQACVAPVPLCAHDLELAKLAWKYFETNYQAATGLVNAVDAYKSTTMWDTASALAATIAANQMGLLPDKDFDDRITALLATLETMPLYRNEVPNKAYNTTAATMVDYTNHDAADGIGYSAIDLSRLVTWLGVLSALYPRYTVPAKTVLHRWSYCRVVHDGDAYGAAYDRGSGKESVNQEGRLGYQQYAAHGWTLLGFDMGSAATYHNDYAQTIDIYGVEVPYDVRDPRKYGAYNYVVTESFALEALEYGQTEESKPLLQAIYDVQKARYAKTEIVTAVSEDNIDRAPWFVYNTIYAAGTPWNTITDAGRDMTDLRTTSVKAAIALAVLFPDDAYSQVLYDKVASAYDPAKGWYSGIYESGAGYNKAITANTNAIVLESLLYKMLGPFDQIRARCGGNFALAAFDSESSDKATAQCFPAAGSCAECNRKAGIALLKPLPTVAATTGH